jgi:hypothetical protein
MVKSLNKLIAHVAIAVLIPLSASAVFAQTTQPTQAQRQTMSERHKTIAEMHSKMAACLESEKPIEQCRQEMTDSCANSFNGTCPMMGQGKMRGRGKGMMGGGNYWDWMMNPSDDSAPKTTPKAGAPGK